MAMPRRAALLVVDVVNPFDFDGARALLRAARAIEAAILRTRAAFDRAGLPVIYCNDNFGQWRSDSRAILAACSATGRPGAAFVTAVAPRPHDLFVLKPKHSAFHATPLELLLRALRVSHLYITGIAGDACVHATAVDASVRDFDVLVVPDATASQSIARNRRALTNLVDRGAARMVSSRAITRSLRANVKTLAVR